ncbi:hypothetical protein SHL_00024 [Pseudomonas phage shl2]|uniref:Uncharacterized protein n=1 Tax=Pseudomonas phage shl2 TaxID=1729933 RepID=A0A160SYH7_9CAUD|nr:hypothetical protein HOV57_gp24 [Pseudomonas phage shl2]UAV89358.1 hypothetical protein FMS_4 [Pseudomonas phage FMS]CUR50714.1 hypothetical protein SHL_00024 [Pseudomonas phage shl2]
MNNANRFILARAACLLVDAYRKCITEYQTVMPLALGISKDAPDTFAKLKAEAAGGKLVVSPEFSETAIYGVAGNITFRVFHDYGHLIYDKEFETAQECELARIQWLDLKAHIPAEWVSVCHAVYFADTCEQSLFEASTGAFPSDQRAFVLDHLANHLAA